MKRKAKRMGRPRLPISERLRRAVTASRMTHLEIAKRTDLAPSTIGRFMLGSDLRLSHAEAVAAAVGVEFELVEPGTKGT